MGLTTHAIARKAHIHPNMGIPISVQALDIDQLVSPIAESGLVAGGYLTIRDLPTAAAKGTISGTARVISANIHGGSSGSYTSVFEVRGINQFGEPVFESMTMAGTSGDILSNHAYSKVTSIKCTAKNGSVDRLVQFGHQIAANKNGIGLPLHIVTTSEAIDVLNNVGVTVAGAFNVQYQTFKGTGALVAGPGWLRVDLANVGKRP